MWARSVVATLAFLLGTFALATLGCEGRPRHENSGSSLNDPIAGTTGPTDVYRFVGIEQSLGDARKAILAERWAEARAAATALLKKEPGHLEAQKIADTAGAEAANQEHFVAFQKAVAGKDVVGVATSFRQIGAESLYFERARPDFEKLREQWATGHENELRALVAKGRCRDAHHVARLANDAFPELRARLDQIADNCRPTVGQEAEPELATAAASAAASSPPSPPVASLQPVASVGSPEPRPEPPPARPVSPPPPVVAPTSPPSAPAKPASPKMIPAFELEKLRVSGAHRPSLPANANRIAHRDGVKQITAGVALCVSATGVPDHVEIVKSSDYSDVDENVITEVSAWRFRPYLAGEAPVPICTRVVFAWQLE